MRLSHKRKIAHKQGRYHLHFKSSNKKEFKKILDSLVTSMQMEMYGFTESLKGLSRHFKKSIEQITRNIVQGLQLGGSVAPITK